MFSIISRFLQLGFLVYVAVAVLYTTRLFLSIATPGILHSVKLFSDSSQGKNTGSEISRKFEIDSRLLQVFSGSAQTPLIWPTDNPYLDGRTQFPAVHEETLLSKAFTQSLHPTKIVPYYFRASSKIQSDDVTIATLVTSNRFKVLRQLVERYQGPISVAIHVPLPVEGISAMSDDHPSIRALKELHELYYSSPHFSDYVDVHLAVSPFSRSVRGSKVESGTGNDGQGEGGRQFNLWRNVARLFARTEFVMMLDVDFAVCTDWRSAVRKSMHKLELNDREWNPNAPLNVGPAWRNSMNETARLNVFKRLRAGTAALVVPVFEYLDQEDGSDQRIFPRDKETLLRLVLGSAPKIASFHASWAVGHNSTNYAQYYSIPPGQDDIYPVGQYQSAYEPYVIMSKNVPWCDERFTGYGANKAACLFEMYLSGVSFFVMSDHFLIHQSHKYEEQARREERKYNRKLYTDFKEEACLRYLHRFHVEGMLNSSKATNVKEECKKVKTVQKIASELFSIEL
ncbi:unnamed protein product [Somion occarium]|uniref:Glycosyltransferase family 49 protein n=1 Tax=Somion occarium TaxID=3059160 RepID=A0ABP1CS30_9APHY